MKRVKNGKERSPGTAEAEKRSGGHISTAVV